MKRALVLLAAFILTGCGGAAAPAASTSGAGAANPGSPSAAASAKPAGSAASAAATAAGASGVATASSQPATKLVVSYGELVPQSVPEFLAKDVGIYQQHGIDADLRLIVSSAEIAALVSGETQIASSGGPIVLSAVAGGADLVVTAAIAGLSPFALYVQPSIKTIADLKGKNVGISKFGSPSDIAMRMAMRKNGMDPNKDVRFVELGSTQARTAALLQGTIDGGMANPLEAQQLIKGGLHVVYDATKDHQPSAQSVVVAKRDWVAGHREVMQRYVDAIVQAIARTNQDKATSVATMKKWFKSDDDQLMGSVWDAYSSSGLWPNVPYATPEMFADAKEVIAATNPKMADYDVTKLLDNSFVKSAEERGLTGKK
ncbi:MAG TPA: ABC transporter substrate-binding protein [Chloroflexota bacterium]|nr:ABC transporter substrate-binding protein [Chloroflexota bacterium]